MINLITMAAAGILAACVVYVANHLSGRRLPQWLMPAAIGAAMIGVSIYGEYMWFRDERANLPATTTVLRTVEESAPWRPWTYLAPITTRFIALDSARVIRSATQPDLVAAEITLVQRWAEPQRVPVAFDCKAGLRADLVEGAALEPDGTLSGATWAPIGPDEDILKAACNGG